MMWREQASTPPTCFVVAKADGGERDEGIVDADSEAPVLEVLEYERGNDGEKAEEYGETDDHAGDMLAKRPHATELVVA